MKLKYKQNIKWRHACWDGRPSIIVFRKGFLIQQREFVVPAVRYETYYIHGPSSVSTSEWIHNTITTTGVMDD